MAFLEVAGGAAIGFALSELSSRLTRREERKYLQRERSEERQRDAVEVLDEATREAKWRLPLDSAMKEAPAAIFAAHDAWQLGEFQAGALLRDTELTERHRAAGWALLQALLDSQREGRADLWITTRAIDSAREGFAAFLLGEPLPPPSFPTKAEAVKLSPMGPDGRDYSALHSWLVQRGLDEKPPD